MVNIQPDPSGAELVNRVRFLFIFDCRDFFCKSSQYQTDYSLVLFSNKDFLDFIAFVVNYLRYCCVGFALLVP